MTSKDYDRLLRKAIAEDPRSARQLAIDAGIPAPSVTLYIRRKRSLSWDSAAKLMVELGIVPTVKKKRKKTS